MLQDYINEFREGKDGEFSIYSIGYAPACGLSLDLANKYKVNTKAKTMVIIFTYFLIFMCRIKFNPLYLQMIL